MRKVQIIGPKALLDDCIRLLHAASVVHIESVAAGAVSEKEEYLKKLPLESEKLREKEALDKAADRLRNLLSLLHEPPGLRIQKISEGEIKGALEELTPVEREAKSLRARIDELNEELSVVNKYEKLLRGFAPIVSRLGGLKNFEIIGLTIEKTREDVSKLLAGEIGRITGGSFEMHVRDLDETTVGMVITYPKRFDSQIKFLLSGKAISEIRLPDEYQDMTLLNALKMMAIKKAELPRIIGLNEKDLSALSEKWYAKAAGVLRAVEDASDEIGVLAYAAQTRFTFVVEGWVPSDVFGELSQKFDDLFGGKIYLRELEIKEEETELIPVYIHNPRILKPFEVFLAALPPPKYGSIDPTPFVAIFFPAFFGLIVGDIGYGAVIFGLSLYLKKKLKDREMLRDIASVLSVSAISAIIFGILFGELFGDLGERLGILHPIIFHRTEALRTLLVLTIGIGIGHVLLGIIIGAVNYIYRGKTKEAGAKLAYFTVVVSFLLILAVMFGYLPKGLLTPGVMALIASFVALTVLEGILGPLEFIKALGNMLSYVRIMAIGTASVVMALVANKIGGLSESLVVGAIAAGLIHILNLILSILSPSIQSMRLHYVEFFSKFYEGGGRKYMPFRKR